MRVIAGQSHGVQGAVQREATQPLYLNLELEAGAGFEQALPAGHTAFVVVYRGELIIGGITVSRQRLALLKGPSDANGVRMLAGTQGARALLLAGRPLREPIVQHGPFVMNSRAEILQAFEDYNAGRLA